MLREIEVTLILGPGHDRAVMPDGTVLEGRDEEELARSIMVYLVPGIFEGYEPPANSEGVHVSVMTIEEELLQKFLDTFLSGVRPGSTTISESSAFGLMVEDVLTRTYDLEEEWYIWKEEMDEAGYDPDQFSSPPELLYLDELLAEIVNEADRRWYDPGQLTFLPRERSTMGRRW